MTRLDALTAVVFALLIPLVSSQFRTPIDTRRQLFHVGEVQKIQYQTNLTSYTIAIWQQALTGGSAILGPILFETNDGPESEFDWTVQLYDFDLETSNVFFFWMKEGGPENVGLIELQANSSAYFNITDEPAPSSSTSISSTTTTTSTSSSTTAESSTLSTGAGMSTAPGTSESESGSEKSGEEGGGGLSVAAQAGIGVGVSIVGIMAIVCGILWLRYRKQQRRLEELEKRLHSQAPPVAYDAHQAGMWKSEAHVPSPDAPKYYPGVGGPFELSTSARPELE